MTLNMKLPAQRYQTLVQSKCWSGINSWAVSRKLPSSSWLILLLLVLIRHVAACILKACEYWELPPLLRCTVQKERWQLPDTRSLAWRVTICQYYSDLVACNHPLEAEEMFTVYLAFSASGLTSTLLSNWNLQLGRLVHLLIYIVSKWWVLTIFCWFFSFLFFVSIQELE